MDALLSILHAHEPAELALIFCVFVLAGLVKGVVGLGLPTVAVGLLGMMMAPREAAALLVVPSLVTNVWQLAAGPAAGALARRLWPMLAGIAAGTLLGGMLLPVSASADAVAALGGALMMYAAAGLASFTLHVPPRGERAASPVVGLVTGAVTAATASADPLAGSSMPPMRVPAAIPTSIGHRRRASAPAAGPAASCQTFVTSEGTTNKAAASRGAIIIPNKPTATVGKPSPTTPLTRPASTNTRKIKVSSEAECACKMERKVSMPGILAHERRFQNEGFPQPAFGYAEATMHTLCDST